MQKQVIVMPSGDSLFPIRIVLMNANNTIHDIYEVKKITPTWLKMITEHVSKPNTTLNRLTRSITT